MVGVAGSAVDVGGGTGASKHQLMIKRKQHFLSKRRKTRRADRQETVKGDRQETRQTDKADKSRHTGETDRRATTHTLK